MHVKITNGIPEIYTIGQLRRDNPNTSFPKSIPEETLAAYGVFPLSPTERPDVGHTKNVTEAAPKQIDGVWTQTWSVSDASPEEIAIRIEEASLSVRSERDYMLQQSDWMALNDTPPMSEAWASYRQALRDITSQAGFPYDVTWPEKPSS